jgi:hypothetical protein
MTAITIRGIDSSVSEKLKQAAQQEGKSVNGYILELISQKLGMQKKKTHSKQYNDLDNLFGKWSKAEYEKIQGTIDRQRKIDPELWQ